MCFDIANLIIGILSLIATIALAVVIYKLEKKHQFQIRNIEEKRLAEKIELQANKFISEHNKEIDYLQLCVFANSLNKYKVHNRKIYNDFRLLESATQQKILEILQIGLKELQSGLWLEICLTKFRKTVKRNDLGRDVLYDGHKYFDRAFDRHADYKVDLHSDDIRVFERKNKDFKPIFENFFNERLNMLEYINELFEDAEYKKTATKPFDIMRDYLGNADENKYCYWTLQTILATLIILYNKESRTPMFHIDINCETLEDLYYECCYYLYIYYILEDQVEK